MIWIQKRANKYGAISSEYNGIIYHSKLEAKRAWELDMLKKAKEIKSWERQKRFKFFLVKNGKKWILTDKEKEIEGKRNIHLCDYYLDFVVIHNDKMIEFEEVKGMELSEWKKKWKYLEALYGDNPNYKLTVIKG